MEIENANEENWIDILLSLYEDGKQKQSKNLRQ